MTAAAPARPRNPTLRFFTWAHLPAGLMRDTSQACAELVEKMQATLPESAEKSAGVRKLLEAKDCFVRAAMPPEI